MEYLKVDFIIHLYLFVHRMHGDLLVYVFSLGVYRLSLDCCMFLIQTLTEPDLFKEAIQYVLPKSLLEPLYHCVYYFEAMNVSIDVFLIIMHEGNISVCFVRYISHPWLPAPLQIITLDNCGMECMY